MKLLKKAHAVIVVKLYAFKMNDHLIVYEHISQKSNLIVHIIVGNNWTENKMNWIELKKIYYPVYFYFEWIIINEIMNS